VAVRCCRQTATGRQQQRTSRDRYTSRTVERGQQPRRTATMRAAAMLFSVVPRRWTTGRGELVNAACSRTTGSPRSPRHKKVNVLGMIRPRKAQYVPARKEPAVLCHVEPPVNRQPQRVVDPRGTSEQLRRTALRAVER